MKSPHSITNNRLLAEVKSLPSIIEPLLDDLEMKSAKLVGLPDWGCYERIYLIGCGDSYFAGLGSELFFKKTTRLPSRALTAMAFSRYESGFIDQYNNKSLVIAISSSGRVSRTIEAMELARKAGAAALAVTMDGSSPLAEQADFSLEIQMPLFPAVASPIPTPGCRSYIASLLALFTTAIHLGEAVRGEDFERKFFDLLDPAIIGKIITNTIIWSEPIAKQAASAWKASEYFVFCGAGPSFGAASFSAAKLIEASGAAAFAQDLEEWAHLQYFDSRHDIPTIIISAEGWDGDRTREIAVAAETIGRDLAIVAPAHGALLAEFDNKKAFQVDDHVEESISPLVTSIPGLLLAAYHSDLIGAVYFRGFKGGRSPEGGGGISRIQSSHRQRNPRR